MEVRISGFSVLLALWAGVAIIYVPDVFPQVRDFVVNLISDHVVKNLPWVACSFTVVYLIAKLAVGQHIGLQPPVNFSQFQPHAVSLKWPKPQ